MNIFITGGCGYVGTVLTNSLLNDGHKVTVYDTQWFGNYLNNHKNLKIIRDDIRNIQDHSLAGFNSVMHMANIANDPAVELDQTLSWEVNVLASHLLAEKAKNDGVNQIIYASSGSVYGIKDEPEVTEDLSLLPISIYNKTKMVAERVFFSYQDDMKVHCIRPATVCGFSPRMRLDISVNMLTMQALTKKIITVFGGKQVRPNININDLVRVYKHFLINSEIRSGAYNAGFENISILEIAERIKSKIPTEIMVTESNDPRSYRQNSDKLISTGFKPEFNVNNAIDEIIEKFNQKELSDKEEYYTIKTMKKLFK